ncbi:MAG: tandem-95 repeat protein [Aggregatilineales bacterium]
MKKQALFSKGLFGVLVFIFFAVAAIQPVGAQVTPYPPSLPVAYPDGYQGSAQDPFPLDYYTSNPEWLAFRDNPLGDVAPWSIYEQGYRGWRSISPFSARRNNYLFGHWDAINPRFRTGSLAPYADSRLGNFRPILGTPQDYVQTYCDTAFTSGDTNWNDASPNYDEMGWEQTPQWREITVDLSDFAGRAVAISWYFDAGDTYFNQHEGWYVDDIEIGPLLDQEDRFDVPPGLGSVTPGESYFTSDADDEAAVNAMLVYGNGNEIPTSQRPIVVPFWHNTDRRSYSGDSSWWFGNPPTAVNNPAIGTYGVWDSSLPDTLDFSDCSDQDIIGAYGYGRLMTPVIELGANPTLTFQTLWMIESAQPDLRDTMRIEIAIDHDRDGIIDFWEEGEAIDVDGNGVINDSDRAGEGYLPLADPDYKNIYVELDCMDIPLLSICMSASAIADVERAFRNIPITNPDGTTGINIEIDTSGRIPFQSSLSLFEVREDRITYSDQSRRGVFHYGAVAPQVRTAIGDEGGQGELSGDEFIIEGNRVFLDGSTPFYLTEHYDTIIAEIFMHELGHNLGLFHGGNSLQNYKPNYFSIMNYALPGIQLISPSRGIERLADGVGNDDGICEPNESCRPELRYSYEILGTLFEGSLFENTGIPGSGTDPVSNFYTKFSCAETVLSILPYLYITSADYITPADGPIDWNCNGLPDVLPIRSDVNQSGFITDLEGSDDRREIDLVFGDNYFFHSQLTNVAPDQNDDERLRNSEDPDADVTAPLIDISGRSASSSGNPTVEITLTDPVPPTYASGLRLVRLTGNNVVEETTDIPYDPRQTTYTFTIESTDGNEPEFELFVQDYARNTAVFRFNISDVQAPVCELAGISTSNGQTVMSIVATDNVRLNGAAPTLLENAEFLDYDSDPNLTRAVMHFVKLDEAQPMRVDLTIPDVDFNETNCSFTDADTIQDTDSDGVSDRADNCPLIANTNQSDSNGDGVGDACSAATVPDLSGMTQSQAENALQNAGFTTGIVGQSVSVFVPVGQVVVQNPTAGSSFPPGTPVDFNISSGIILPDLTGLPQAQAESILYALQLTPGTITTGNSDTVPIGAVISHTPSSGATLTIGDPVDLVISVGRSITVPDVVGLAQTAAETALQNETLVVGTIAYTSSAQPADSVVSQSPSAGTSVNEGTAVDLVLSLGDLEQTTVPDVVGLLEADAQTAISNANLYVSSTTSISSIEPVGTVLDQSPPAGTTVDELTGVEITVSLGGFALVPDVVGLLQADAETAITNANLIVGTVSQQTSTTVPAGNVISQTPPPNTEVNTGNAVDLVVSSGSPGSNDVIVPDLTGLTLGEAIAALQNAGLNLGTIIDVVTDQFPENTVIGQTPLQGSIVIPGTAVAIELARSRADIRLSRDCPDVVEMGEYYTCTLNYENVGTETATNLNVYMTVPPSTLFVDASQGGIFNIGGGRSIHWSVADLPAGESEQVSATVGASCAPLPEQWQYYRATHDDAPFASTISVIETVDVVLHSFLPVSISVESVGETGDPVLPGQIITHTLTLTNAENTEHRNLLVRFVPGTGMDFDTIIDDGGWSLYPLSNGTYDWRGTLAANETRQIVFTTRVQNSLPPTQSEVTLNNSPLRITTGCFAELGRATPPSLTILRPVAVNLVALNLPDLGASDNGVPGLSGADILQVAHPESMLQMEWRIQNQTSNDLPTVRAEIQLPPDVTLTTLPAGVTQDSSTGALIWTGALAGDETQTLVFDVDYAGTDCRATFQGTVASNGVDQDGNRSLSILTTPPIGSDPYLIGTESFRGLWVLSPTGERIPTMCVIAETANAVSFVRGGDLYVTGLPSYRINPLTLEFEFMDFNAIAGMTVRNVANNLHGNNGDAYFIGTNSVVRYNTFTRQTTPIFSDPNLNFNGDAFVDLENRLVLASGTQVIRVDLNGSFPIDPANAEVFDVTTIPTVILPGTVQQQQILPIGMNTEGDYLLSLNTISLEPIAPNDRGYYEMETLLAFDRLTGNTSVIHDVMIIRAYRQSNAQAISLPAELTPVVQFNPQLTRSAYRARMVSTIGDVYVSSAQSQIESVGVIRNGQGSILNETTSGNLITDMAWFEIIDGGGNNIPVANDSSVSTQQNTPVNVTISAFDVDGDALTYTILSQPQSGNLTGAPPTLTYTPNTGFFGVDTFTFEVSDGQDASNTATVTVTVNEVIAPNTPPVANDDSAVTDENQAVTIDVLTNDSDADGDTLSVTGTTTPTNGTVIVNPDNTLTYTPDTDFFGTDSFDYTLSDGEDTDMATVTVTVNEVIAPNNPPVANDDSATTDKNQVVTIDVLINDTDSDGDTLSVTGTTTPTNGMVTINPDNTITYTPDNDFFGSDSFDYTISDGTNSDTATVTVNVNEVIDPNTPPVANDDSATTDENQAVTIDVLINDTDADGDTLSVTGTTTPTNGSVIINPDNTLTYTPDTDFFGTDSFDYTLSDGNDTNTATVTVTVNEVIAPNNPPVATDDSATTDENQAVTIAVLTNDSDADGDTLSVTGTTSPGNGSVSINPDNTLTYTPDTDFFGTDSFDYTISDGEDTDSATVTVTVNEVIALNTPPVANDDSAVTDENQAVTIDVLTNDTDADGDTLSVTGTNTPTNGMVTVNPDNTVTYTPDTDFFGTDSFDYNISDGTDTDSATVTVNVNETALPDCATVLVQGRISTDGTVGTLTYIGAETACELRVGIASYKKLDGSIDTQIIHDYRVMDHIFAPNQPLTLTITVPQCATQIDLFYGDVIEPTFGSQRYGARLIAARHLNGNGYCIDPSAPPPPTCETFGALRQEAEDGLLSNAFVIGQSNSASEGHYISAPDGSGNSYTLKPARSATYCFDVPEAGIYQIMGRVLANNGTSDSFFVSINGAVPFIWDVAGGSHFVDDLVNDRLGEDPVLITLPAGGLTITLYVREDGARLDTLELMRLPEPATCDGLVHEAENATFHGAFVIGNDNVASGDHYIHIPNGTGNFYTLNSAHSATYCFDVPEAGDYSLRGWVYAPNDSSDSFFVSINDGTPFVWDTLINSRYLEDDVRDRNGHDPVIVNLPAGEVEVVIYAREDGTRLDRLELVAVEEPENQPPNLLSPGTQSNTVSESVSLQMEAIDDSDVLTYYAVGLPDGLAIDPESGQITGIVAPDARENSPFVVTVTVSDDGDPALTDEVTFGWTILDELPQSSIQVTGFTLIDARTDQVIETISIEDGTVIDRDDLPDAINIRVDTNPQVVGSVYVSLSGAASQNRTENAYPYAVFTDNNGNYANWRPVVGDYLLVARPYPNSNQGGTAGADLSIRFTITE